MESHLGGMFDSIDADGNGLLDAHELAAFLDRSGVVCSGEQIDALLSEADVDCDGQLSVEEFKIAVLSLLEEDFPA